MKKSLILALVLLSGMSTVRAQSFYFKLQVDSLPSIHSWDNYTDYSESGHLTHSFGTDSSFMGLDVYPSYDDKKTVISNDTFVFITKREFTDDPHGKLTLVFDNIPKHLRSFEFMLTPGEDYTRKTARLFKAENIDLVETATTFEFQLTGEQILHHNVFDSSYNYEYQQSGNMSFETISVYMRDTIVPGSSIYFTISKDHLTTNSVSSNISTETLSVYPTIASTVITVQLPAHSDNVLISDILGRIVKTVSLSDRDSKLQIDISSIEPGIYYIQAGNQIQKIVIRR